MTFTGGGGAHPGTELIQLHFLGELAPARSDAVHQHVRGCERCGAEAAEIVDLLAILALGADRDELPVPPAIKP